MIEPDCISWNILWPHLNTLQKRQWAGLKHFFDLHQIHFENAHWAKWKISFSLQYLYILWGDVYDLSPLLPALISQPRRFVCALLDKMHAGRPANHGALSKYSQRGSSLCSTLPSQTTVSHFDFNFNTQTESKPARKLKYWILSWKRKKKNKASLTMLWVVEKTSKWIFTPVASSSRGSPGHVLNPPSWEGVCFISAEIPAKTPQVRDTGCGYSAHGWFISTH